MFSLSGKFIQTMWIQILDVSLWLREPSTEKAKRRRENFQQNSVLVFDESQKKCFDDSCVVSLSSLPGK
uniref:Uncharacterized protein n=1 Tax=Marseillevirus sp. TaxID=2809551 RepID=A0AA96J0U8_9VIRU|nr:hypothetical protein MarFTMF_481 [Marseillevirus sp.]